MKVVNSRQRWAACVMIAFLVILVSLWAMAAAGDRALRRAPCASKVASSDLKQTILDLELTGEAPRDPCVRSWVKAEVKADFLFIPGYSSFLAFTLFLLSLPRYAGDPPAAWIWKGCGVVLAIVMAAADVMENRGILHLLAGRDSPHLWYATATKWWVISLAVILAGLLALKRRYGRWRWLMVLMGATGLVTGVILAASVYQRSADWVRCDTTIGLFLFFLLVLIHAIVVLVRSDPRETARPSPRRCGAWGSAR
jgi:hypothetical protein